MFQYLDSFCHLVAAYPVPSIISFIVFLILLKKYINGGVCKYTQDLTGKIIVITGASAGIGKYTTQELARMGGTVIMACRDIPKTEEAKASILKSAADPSKLKIDIIRLDLCDLSSIREFVKIFKAKYNRLDILINNAGVMAIPDRRLTKDGFEMQIGTNHFGHFLLTNLLLDVIKASKPSRIINLASMAHLFGYLNLDDINSEKFSNNQLTYGGSKLANILFTKELAKKLEGTGVKTVCLHPGAVRTELMRHVLDSLVMKIIIIIMFPFYWYFFKSTQQGAQTTLHCALISHEKLENGKYYSDCQTKWTRSAEVDSVKMKKLWEISEKMVNL